MCRIAQIAEVIYGRYLLLLSRIPQTRNSSTPALIRKLTMARIAILHNRCDLVILHNKTVETQNVSSTIITRSEAVVAMAME